MQLIHSIAQLKLVMKGKGKLYDFNDFVEVINLYGIAVEMNSTDFKLYQKALIQGKDMHYPLLCDVVEVCFKAKSTKIFWKERFADQEFKVANSCKRNTVNLCTPSEIYPNKRV